jgi:hypothetical protein
MIAKMPISDDDTRVFESGTRKSIGNRQSIADAFQCRGCAIIELLNAFLN